MMGNVNRLVIHWRQPSILDTTASLAFAKPPYPKQSGKNVLWRPHLHSHLLRSSHNGILETKECVKKAGYSN